MMYITIFLVLILLNVANSFLVNNPKCQDCIWYVSNPVDKKLGFCRVFTNKAIINNKEKIVYNYAYQCRNNYFLCGENAWFFENDKKKENAVLNLIPSKNLMEIEKNTQDLISFYNFNRYNTNDKNLDNNEKKSYEYYINNIAKYNKKNYYKDMK